MAGKVVNSGIVARFGLFPRWIMTHSANRHLPYCQPLAFSLKKDYETIIKSKKLANVYPDNIRILLIKFYH